MKKASFSATVAQHVAQYIVQNGAQNRRSLTESGTASRKLDESRLREIDDKLVKLKVELVELEAQIKKKREDVESLRQSWARQEREVEDEFDPVAEYERLMGAPSAEVNPTEPPPKRLTSQVRHSRVAGFRAATAS